MIYNDLLRIILTIQMVTESNLLLSLRIWFGDQLLSFIRGIFKRRRRNGINRNESEKFPILPIRFVCCCYCLPSSAPAHHTSSQSRRLLSPVEWCRQNWWCRDRSTNARGRRSAVEFHVGGIDFFYSRQSSVVQGH